MPEFYNIIPLMITSAAGIFFFIKWRMESRVREFLQIKYETEEAISMASIGGYYYYSANNEDEFFSTNLVKMLNLQKKLKNLKQMSKLFGFDSEKIVEEFENIKNGYQDSKVFNCKAEVLGEIKNLQCLANKLTNEKGKLVGIVLWFFDISEYIVEINNLRQQNNKNREEIREYSNILNSLPIPVWKRDANFKIKYSNLIYSQFVDGKSFGRGKGQDIPEIEEHLKDISKIAYANKRPLHMKKHFVVGGERRFYDVSEVAMTQDDGVIGIAYDITRQEEIENELARHITAHADLLESSSSAMAIYGSDTKLKFYNNAFVKLWGFDEDWLNSNPGYAEFLELLREKRNLPEQADFKKFRSDQLKLFKDLIKPHNEFFYLPDGKTLRVIVIPHALGGLLFAYEDMTNHFAMERSYNTLIAVQKETLDNLREGVAVFGSDGILKLYNPVYAQLWPDEIEYLDKNPHSRELIELSKSMFKYGDDWEAFRKNWTERPTTRKPIHRRAERTDGKVIDKLIVPLPDGAFLLSYEDVTASILAERSLMERNEALEEADKLKTEFLANVSYELRTPLTSIMGFSEVLKKEYFGKLNEKQHEYMKSICISSEQLMGTINDILDLASIEAGYLILEKKEIDVADLITFVAAIVKLRCKEAGLKFSLDCDGNVGSIVADDKRIKQVLFNIIGNSIKFTSKGGNIVLGAKTISDDEVVIWVQDTGVGIPYDERDKVFEKFFKSNTAISINKSGTGLGLPVVKNIVELHGGRVEIESEEGSGTKVICYLKRAGKKIENKKKKLKNA